MPRKSTAFEILIASPGDIVSERLVLAEVIEDWNSAHARPTGIMLQARRWELDAVPSMADRPQALINKQLVDEADILIAVFSTRLGSPTGVAASGTVEEIERLRSTKKPVFVYFSKAPVPRDHDAAQLQLLNEYKRDLSKAGLYFEFDNDEMLRRMASRHLASTMSTIAGLPPEPTPKSDLARVYVQTGQAGRSGDVRTVKVSAVIENISPVKRITEYTLTFSVPRACLTFTSSSYMDEIKSEDPTRRVFRRSESSPGVVRTIFAGDKAPIFALDLGVDQLKLKGTYLAGDIEAVLADKVTIDAVVDGEPLYAEKPVAEIFAT